MTLEVPEPLTTFLAERAAKGGFARPEDYLPSLVGQARRAAARERVDAMLRAGLGSGPPIVADDAYWDAKVRRLEAAHGGERPS